MDSAGILCLPEGRCHDSLFVCREQMESQLEKEARFRQLMAHSSHDSAIDTDSMEWETEVVEFERETVNCPQVSSTRRLGTEVRGGPALSQCPPASWLLVGRSAFPPGAQMHPLPALVRARWHPQLGLLCPLADVGSAWRAEHEGAVCLQWQRGVDHSRSELSSWGPSALSE